MKRSTWNMGEFAVMMAAYLVFGLLPSCITNVYSPQNQDDPRVRTDVQATGAGSTADVWVDGDRQDGASEAEQKSKADVKTDLDADVDASALPDAGPPSVVLMGAASSIAGPGGPLAALAAGLVGGAR